MYILYHHRTQAEDAQGIHIQEMIRAFRDLGHEVEICAIVSTDDPTRGARGKAWRNALRFTSAALYELLGLAYNVVGYLRLRRLIRRRRPDLVYERYSLHTVCGVLAARCFGIPHILEVNAPLRHEQSALEELTFPRLAHHSERWICAHSTRTIVVSQAMKDLLRREGVPGESMVVVPNGIDPREFHPRIRGATVRERYGLGSAVVLGFVGWFRKWHGLEMLVEAVATLDPLQTRVLLIGDGPAYEDARRAVAARGLDKSILFTGPLPRAAVPQHIAAMDIAVQPSATEYACPMKIIEYMAMAKCIVAPDQANVRELLEHGVNGWLFPPGDGEALRATLHTLARDPEARRRTGRQAYQSVYQRRLLWRSNAATAIRLAGLAPPRDSAKPACEDDPRSGARGPARLPSLAGR